jgi:anti-sigma B factor antagonist
MNPVLGPVTIVERAPGRFSISGEIDMASAPLLDQLSDVHGPLLLDLHGVTFMDSSGIRALILLTRRCPHADCTLHIETSSLPVERVLRIAGLYDILTDGHNGVAPAPSPSPGVTGRTAAPLPHSDP